MIQSCQFKIFLENPAFDDEHLGFSMIIPVTALTIKIGVYFN